MTIHAGADIVNSNLIISIDANNRKSYIDAIPTQSSINTSNWTIGTGGITAFTANGLTAENQRLVDTDPWGNQSIVWGSYPTADSSGDGGWDGSYFSIDNTKLYRSSVWVRRTSDTTGGTFYKGLHTNGTGDVFHLSDSVGQGNPYWDYRGIGALVKNQWYLVIGHIFPNNYTGTTAHVNSGLYLAGSITKVANLAGNVPNDVKFPSNATTANQRVYHYYSTDNTSRLQFAYPRWDLVDGKEPTISDLIFDSSAVAYNVAVSTSNAICVSKVPPIVTDVTKCFDFSANLGLNATTAITGFSFSPQPIPTTGNFTINSWVKSVPTTVGQQIFFSNTAGADGYRYGIGVDGIYYLIGPTYTEGTLGYGTTFSNTQWNNVCTIYDRAGTITPGTPKVYLYLNGVLSNSVSIPASQTAFTNTASAYMAKGLATFPSYSGKLAKMDIYSKALTATEVIQNFNAARSRFGL